MRPVYLIATLCAGISLACQPAASSGQAEHAMSANTFESAEIQNILSSAANPWTIDRTESTISFVGKQQGEEFTGCFDRFDLAIDLDPDNPSTGSIHLDIDMTSAIGGSDDRNSAIPGKDWFDVNAFPTAKFVSTDIRRDGKNSYVAKGELLLKGVSKTVELPFTLDVDGDNAHAVGQTDLNRLDFNVGTGAFKTDEWIDFKVIVKVDITASR